MRTTRLLLLALLGLSVGVLAQPVVIATSEVFGSLARTLAGEEILVITIIPAGFCPAHYDLRPSDFLFLAKAEVVFYHGIETWLDRFLANVNPEAKRVHLRGPWNYPEALAEKARAVAAALGERFPEKASLFQERLARFLEELAALEEAVQARAAQLNLREVPAIVMVWQEGFARWLGLNIVATYPPEERLTLKDLATLAQKGQEAGVKLVIDNLQSGVSFGGRLAHALGASHVVLTNFPGPIPRAVDMLSMLRVNAELVFAAVEALQGVAVP
ncbi:MAG: metal ABC transporter substrate-binding protein [Candidatus Bipolaricaulota bacterium]|nr:metal ABC transporter substrate-binding protein [Candidatus Bipolaricaulota bacterium]MDW8152073.1 metal ABC transporter substrate-binding protein [Candidatus Bipolaricaulota bacterium]